MSASTIHISIPPTIIIASGFCTSEPMPVDSAAGNSPIDPISAIIIIGLMRLCTALDMASLSDVFFRRFSFITAMRMILLIVFTPKRMMKPIPADMPKTVPVIQSEMNPPMKAKGMVLAAISVSFTVPKLKYSRKRIRSNTVGTINTSCLEARSLLSNSPAHTTL